MAVEHLAVYALGLIVSTTFALSLFYLDRWIDDPSETIERDDRRETRPLDVGEQFGGAQP